MSKNIFMEDNDLLNRTRSEFHDAGTKTFLSAFLFPWEISLTRCVLMESDLTIEEWGGFDSAAKKRVLGSSHRIRQSMFRIMSIEFKPVSMLRYSNRKSVINAFSNRDVPPDALGDIILAGDSWYVMLDSKYKSISFGDVEITIDKRLPVDFLPEKQVDITGTTSSVRLDSICSVAHKPSRSRLKGLIENGGAMIDYNFVYKGSKEISEGSIISLKGFPRIRLSEIGDVTKKGRIRVRIEFMD